MKIKEEKLIKSRKRVKEFAEVYTPDWLVKDMCDLIPQQEWEKIDSVFLEPACGNGNFLVEIFARKLKLCKDERDGLKALNAIIGIDIQEDNCIEARERLISMYRKAFPSANDFCLIMAASIVRARIICGDSLKITEQWAKEKENNNDD